MTLERPLISVIIPTLNEAETLPATLQHIRANSLPHEITVVDGGSTDGTLEIARAFQIRVIVHDRRQRAAQMNRGAAEAKGRFLLFLHADTRIAPTAFERIQKVLQHSAVVGGAFARRFDCPSLFLRFTCRMAEIRGRLLGWQLGDQAIFIRRELFRRLGGFREIDLFEDLDLSRRMARSGRVVTLRPPVISSARRFKKKGPIGRTLSDLYLTARYLKGEDPNLLAAQLKQGEKGK